MPNNKIVVYSPRVTFERRQYQNGDAIRNGLVPCETNPDTGGLSRTSQPFHAVATLTAGSQKGNKRHVCAECADRHHKHMKHEGGVIWD